MVRVCIDRVVLYGSLHIESSLIKKVQRVNNIRAQTVCSLYTLSSTDLNQLLLEHPEMKSLLEKKASYEKSWNV